jgi:hypothetical protein
MILEYNITDPFNIKIHKKYSLGRPDSFVGQRFIAVNSNYILHLMINPESGDQVIRVYSRHANNFNSALVEIPVSSDA